LLTLLRHCRNEFSRIGSAADHRGEMLRKDSFGQALFDCAGLIADERVEIRVGRSVGWLGRALSTLVTCVRLKEMRSARGDIAKAAG
jgi:hypothetical protein